jgi:cellulose synthase/poly-beta-1,6-N-acetylglucosamine synthase-like glycosyltransferase
MVEALFWTCALAVTYHYVLYPAIVIAIARRRPELRAADPAEWPRVSFVIAAYNEERVIDWKIRNTLSLDYPRERLEVIVVSDGSSDSTPEIVASHAGQDVVSLHEPARRGKTAALNRALRQARGEIIVFSDANNEFSPDAIRELVRHFGDPMVGGVCGAKRIKPAEERESSKGDGMYWAYESAVKLAESRIHTISNADGEIFAIRRELYVEVPEHIINDDAEITLNLIRQGKRILYEPRAQSHEYASVHIKDDFYVKVRMVAGGYQTLSEHARELLPWRSWFTWAFFSHKTLRWLAPIFLLGLLAASAVLAWHPFYRLALVLQAAFYALAVAGMFLIRRGPLPTLLYVPFYFTTMNAAAFMGLVRFLRRTQGVNWRKAQR